MAKTISRTWQNGAVQVFDSAAYVKREQAKGREHVAHDLATCGTCARTWDDGHVSGVTPTPGARCPFEYSH